MWKSVWINISYFFYFRWIWIGKTCLKKRKSFLEQKCWFCLNYFVYFHPFFSQCFLWNLWFTFVEDFNFHLGNEGEQSCSIKIDEHLSLNQVSKWRFCQKNEKDVSHLFCLNVALFKNLESASIPVIIPTPWPCPRVGIYKYTKSLAGNLVGWNWSEDHDLLVQIDFFSFCCCLTILNLSQIYHSYAVLTNTVNSSELITLVVFLFV